MFAISAAIRQCIFCQVCRERTGVVGSVMMLIDKSFYSLSCEISITFMLIVHI